MSVNIFGMHDYAPAWAQLVEAAGRQAWAIYTEAIGCDPNDHAGKDFRETGINVTAICRLNNGYAPVGTIPNPEHYSDFAQRAANFVGASIDCRHWIIGNEIAMAWEWPNGQQITLQGYVDCFHQVYAAIKAVQPDAVVIPQAPAPWNANLKYAGNLIGDWVEQLYDMLNLIGLGNLDGIALHTYTHGHDPALIQSDAVMDAPFGMWHYNFRSYQDYMGAIPVGFQHLPVFITETNPNGWDNINNGWIQAAYQEIDQWNGEHAQQICCLALYRWTADDQERFCVSCRDQVIEDFKAALAHDYRYSTETPPHLAEVGGKVVAKVHLNMRRNPGLRGFIHTILYPGQILHVDGGPVLQDGLVWWLVDPGFGENGYVAERGGDGLPLIGPADTAKDPKDGVISELAFQHGIDEKLVRAVIAIEAGSSGFRNGRLLLRFEPHVFLSFFGDGERPLFYTYFQIGSPIWNGDKHRVSFAGDGSYIPFHGNQDMEWQAFDLARSINEDAAYMSCSYGLPQMMGFNHKTCGYLTAKALFEDFKRGETNQIRAMFNYFDRTGAIVDLRRGDLVAFARKYNGPGMAEQYASLIRSKL